MNCARSLAMILDADLATLLADDSSLAVHVHDCAACRAVVVQLQRDTLAMATLLATAPRVAAPRRFVASRRPPLWTWAIPVLGTAGLLLSLARTRPFTDTQVASLNPPAMGRATIAPRDADSVERTTAAVRTERRASRVAEAWSHELRPITLQAVPIEANASTAAVAVTADATPPKPVAIIDNSPTSTDGTTSVGVEREAVLLPQSNPRITVLWLSPTVQRPIP